jgi:hypothetical protein
LKLKSRKGHAALKRKTLKNGVYAKSVKFRQLTLPETTILKYYHNCVAPQASQDQLFNKLPWFSASIKTKLIKKSQEYSCFSCKSVSVSLGGLGEKFITQRSSLQRN